jgi:uncharacterized protein (DUF433 family)
MGNQYVEQRDGGYYLSGTRVSLDSVVYAFLRGESPEGIVESFPALRLEQAYGAIAFCLAHQQMVDVYLQKGRADFEQMREEARRKHPSLYAKLEAARRSIHRTPGRPVMSGFLLDTNIPSELTKPMPEPRVSAWVDAQDHASLYLSVVLRWRASQGVYRASSKQTANAVGTVV